MKTRLTLLITSLLMAPAAGALAQPAAPTAQQLQNLAQVAAARGAGAQGATQLAQAQGGFAPGGRGGPQGAPPGGRGGPGAPGGRGGPPGPGGRGGGRGPVVNATPPDTITEAFRAQASAVTGTGATAHILMVTNYGWMRSTRTLQIGDEFQEGWKLKELDASKAVLIKPDSPDKVIDLSRWTGDTGRTLNQNTNANGATQITFGSVGTVRSTRAAQPVVAARPGQPATTTPNRGAVTLPQAQANGGRGGAAGGAIVMSRARRPAEAADSQALGHSSEGLDRLGKIPDKAGKKRNCPDDPDC